MAHRTSRPGSKKRRTHDRIIAAAGRIARKNGLAAASVSRVMHGAGLTIGGFYAHFPSKRAMDAEVVQATLGGSDRKSTRLNSSHTEIYTLSYTTLFRSQPRHAWRRPDDWRLLRAFPLQTGDGRRGGASHPRRFIDHSLDSRPLSLHRASRRCRARLRVSGDSVGGGASQRGDAQGDGPRDRRA